VWARIEFFFALAEGHLTSAAAMPIESPAGTLTTLEETVFLARRHADDLETHFLRPVLLVVAPAEDWAETTQARITIEMDAVSVQMMPTLVFELTGKSEVTFGRAQQNAVVLPFAAMSKQHGVFRELNGNWSICDSGSKNGTFVDGARVANAAQVPLRDGGSLRFGDVTAKFWLPKSFCLDLRKRLQKKSVF
jgi:hypothetical protein